MIVCISSRRLFKLTLAILNDKHTKKNNMFLIKSTTSKLQTSMSQPADENHLKIQQLCMNSMKVCAVGEDASEIQNGIDFYKYFFTNFPDLRVYFKGAEKYTAEDVQNSERFQKQGQRILLAVHMIVKVFDQPFVFHAYIRETVNRHRQFKMTPDLWNAFWTVWVGYLESKHETPLDDATRKAWADLGAKFAQVARAHLKNSGLPY